MKMVLKASYLRTAILVLAVSFLLANILCAVDYETESLIATWQSREARTELLYFATLSATLLTIIIAAFRTIGWIFKRVIEPSR